MDSPFSSSPNTQTPDTVGFDPFTAMPSYLVAADNHNAYAGDWTLTDTAKALAGGAAGAAAGSAVFPIVGTVIGGIIGATAAATDGKWIGASVLSGAADFYNTYAEISTWAGNPEDKISKQTWIASFDSDLGEYYRRNQLSTELSGFIGGSLIPTTAALKVYNYGTAALNAAKMGRIGTNFSGATGLLAPLQETFAARAVAEMGAKDSAITFLNSNMLKAFGVGVAEEAIQGAVVSIATVATMKASPILEEMDAKDLAWNVLEGALFGGGIGGLIRSAGSFGGVKRGVEALEFDSRKYFYGQNLAEGTPLANKIINAEDNLRSRPKPVVGEDNFTYNDRKFDEASRKFSDESAILTGTLAQGDRPLARGMNEMIASLPDVDSVAEHLVGVTKVARISTTTAEEAIINRVNRALVADPGAKIAEKDLEVVAKTNVSYLKRWGEDAGTMTAEEPKITSLADGIKKDTSLNVNGSGVDGFRNNANPKKRWNFLEASPAEVEARFIWAQHPDGWKPPVDVKVPVEVHDSDLGLMQGIYLKDVPNPVNLIREDGSKIAITSKDQLLNEIIGSKESYRKSAGLMNEAAVLASKKGYAKFTNAEIAKRLDITSGYLEGTAVDAAAPTRNIFAMQTAAEDYTAQMIKAGKAKVGSDTIPIYAEPQYVKIISDNTPVKGVNGNVLEGMAVVKEQQRLARTAADNATSSAVGPELYDQLPNPGAGEVYDALKSGPGQGMVTTANQTYGSTGSFFQQVGAATKRIIKAFIDETTTYLNPSLVKLKTNAPAALEFEAAMNLARKTPEKYYLNPDASELVLRRVLVNEQNEAEGKALQNFKVLDQNAAERIPINDSDTYAALKAHMDRNAVRVSKSKTLSGANGYSNTLDSNALYPPPVDLRKFPHFAFVVDDTVTGAGHTSMIYAATPSELDNLISKVRSSPDKLSVVTKGEAERFHKAMGDYARDETISENSIDVALHRAGVSSSYVPKTDPTKIADSLLDWHLEKDRQLARYAVSTKYSPEFAELKNLGESATNLATSRPGYASTSAYIEGKVANPFQDYIKMALDIPSADQAPLWTAANSFVDRKFSEVYRAVKDAWGDTKSIADADKVNQIFQDKGLKTAYYDAALVAHSNHTAPQGDLQKFVSRANAMLATALLRMDPLNAFNNTVGSTILTGGELKSLLAKIEAGDVSAGALARITVPGSGDSILAPTKLYARAITNFFQSPADRQWAVENGFASRHLMDYQGIIDDLALTGVESVKDLESKASLAYAKFMKFGDLAEKWTGNKAAEEFNRFVSANIMKQITDVAVSQGVLEEKNALSYINTFVNRTQGNYQASQKPLLFQGAVGSAVGLFQTYQFNLAQQLLRHVAEGASKDAAITLGLQSSVYGLHGLPGFDQINAHIIGTMSGNKDHKDLYDATYGLAGKNVGDWLMYGMASNVFGLFHPDLKMNLYTRGDINPRYTSIIPTSLPDVPIVSATAKLFSSLKEGITKSAAGGDTWTSMMQAIEHAGINRPLAGLATSLEALGNPGMQSYSTSTKGNVVVANDLMSLANLTRIAGGKPLDEAIALDAGYRLDAYKKQDTMVRNALGETIKSTVIAGGTPSEDQINTFAAAYAKGGGKQQEFNQFMIDTMKKANTSQVNEIVRHLKNPQAQSMQAIMGGYELGDFSNRNQ